MKSTSLFLCGAFFAGASLASAQTLTMIAPKSGATQGNSNNNIPFSWYPTRYQQVFDATAFTRTTPMPVNSVRLRMNRSFANGRYGGVSVTLSMWLAYGAKSVFGKPVTPKNVSTTFASNIDSTTLKQVINKKTFSLPKLANTSFGVRFPFDSGSTFVWLGSTAGRSVVLEVRGYANTNNNRLFTYPLDAFNVSSGGRGSYRQNGTYLGCKAKSGALVSHYANWYQLYVGSQSHYFYGYGRAPNLPGILLLGSKAMNGQLPGTSCYIVQDILFMLFGTSSGTSGLTRIPVPVPNNPALAKKSFYTQMLWVQPGANTLGITSSRGLIQTIGTGTTGGVETTRLYRYSSSTSNPDNFTTASGRTTGYGLIFQFTN